MSILPDAVLSAVSQFIAPFKSEVQTIGILLVGSYTHGKVDPNSDVDIYIIQNEGTTRERGNLWIDGFEIEYFINPLNQVQEYLRTESHFRPVTAEMIAHSIILKGAKNSRITDLIMQAKKIITTPLDKLSEVDIELAKYQLNDEEKDLLDSKERKDFFAYNLIAHQILNLAIDTFLKHHRERRLKTKLLSDQIRRIDTNVVELLDQIVDSNYEVTSIRNLIAYIETLIGGQRTKEWKLKGSLTFSV